MDGEHLNPQGGAPARDVSARQDYTLFARLHEIGRGRYRVLQPMHAGARGDLYHGQENESGAAIVVRAPGSHLAVKLTGPPRPELPSALGENGS